METIEMIETTTTSENLLPENCSEFVEEENFSNKSEEPDKNQSEAVDEADEKSSIPKTAHSKIPKKFLDKEGNVRVEELAKSYLALEPLINEKAQWTKEKQDLTEKLNRHSTTTPQETTQKALSHLQAGLYAQMLDDATNPDETKLLLEKYKQKPSLELLAQIEDNFSKDNVKKVAVQSQKELQRVNQKVFKQNLEQLKAHMDNFRNQTLEKYRSYFFNPAFCKLFNKAFELTGTNLDVSGLVEMLDEYAKTKVLEFQLQKKRQEENADATSELTGMIPSSKTKKRELLPETNLLEIEDNHLLKKYIQKYNTK